MAQRNLALFPRLAYDAGDDQYLGREGLELVNNLIEWYRFYDGKHWVDDSGRELTPEDLKARNNLDYTPALIKVNLVAWFIDKLASWMFERPVGLACPPEKLDDPAAMTKPGYRPSQRQQEANGRAAARERLLYIIAKQNLLQEKLLKAARDYHIGGGVCAKIHYSKDRGLRIIWRPRLEYWPVYDEDDVDVLKKIHFVAFINDTTIWKQTYRMEEGSCWMEEGLYNAKLELVKSIVEPANLDIPFIPVEIINRGGLTGETEGRSLVKDLKDLNLEFERKLSDNSDSLKFGMFAIKALINAALPTKEEIQSGEAEPLRIAPDAVWTVYGDGENSADIKTVEHKFEYKDALKDHLDTLLSLMHRLANVPDVAPDQIKGYGQLSGFAIKLLFGAIISATSQSMMVWRPRLNRLLGKALYMLNKYDTKQHYESDLVRSADLSGIAPGNLDDLVEIKTSMPVPENEKEIVELAVKKIAGLLQSVKGAMDDLGVENPEALLAEILTEKKSIAEALGGLPDESGDDEDNSAGGGAE